MDGPTRGALVDQFDEMTGRHDYAARDYHDGVLWLGETKLQYIRPVDTWSGLARDDLGIFQMDIMDLHAPETVRNMRFRIVSRNLAEVGQEDSACLLDGEFGGQPLPGKYFDPKPILPDAVEYAGCEMGWHKALEEALGANPRTGCISQAAYEARFA
ncbi:MAG: hypothetical protein Q8Q11_01445 [bacterium]|nr:hypothetical protein [bacterium]MDZ4248070.1 hypothetical protein [Patescibacteria group bacterium]